MPIGFTITGMTTRTVACVLFTLLASGCEGSDQLAVSGAVATSPNTPDDMPIVATTEKVYSIGGTVTEEWASFTTVTDAVFDTNGKLVVVDNLQQRIVVVAPDGNRSHDLSRAGEGPGELRAPASVMAMGDGRLVVYDFGHRSFLVFGPDGIFLEQHGVDRETASIGQIPRSTDLVGRTFRPLPDGRILTFGGLSGGTGRPVEVLGLGEGRDTSIEDRDTLMMAWDLPTVVEQETKELPTAVDNRKVFTFGTMRPHFAPPLLVDVLSDGRVAVVDSVGYRIKLLSPDGMIESVLERTILPRDVTPEVERAVRDAKEAELSGGAGEGTTVLAYGTDVDQESVDAFVRRSLENILLQLTFAAQIPVIEAMGVDSEDRIWVSRTGNGGASDGPTDVFSADGQYLGTLAPDQIHIPTAFGPDGLMAYVEMDDLGIPVVHVVRLLRLEMPPADALD